MLRNKEPTRSSFEPFSPEPITFSSLSHNDSENMASSSILLKIILVSSRVMGGPCTECDVSDAVDNVRDEEADEFGGVVESVCKAPSCP